MTDHIAALHTAYREHLEYAAAIAQTLHAIQHNPITALAAAVAEYDLGNDPDALELANALAATITWDNDP